MDINKESTANLSGHEHETYRFYHFFKKHPVKALSMALQDEQLKHNETILRCSAHISRTGFRIFRDMSFLLIIIKVLTIFAHHRRSLALSAPKNYLSACIKYLIIPGCMTAYWERDRYSETLMNVEGLKDRQIEERYDEIVGKLKERVE